MVLAKETSDKSYRAIKFLNAHVDVIKEKVNESVTINVNGNLIKVNSHLEVKPVNAPSVKVEAPVSLSSNEEIATPTLKSEVVVMNGAKQALLPQSILDILLKTKVTKDEEATVNPQPISNNLEQEFLKAFELKVMEMANNYIAKFAKRMQDQTYTEEPKSIRH